MFNRAWDEDSLFYPLYEDAFARAHQRNRDAGLTR